MTQCITMTARRGVSAMNNNQITARFLKNLGALLELNGASRSRNRILREASRLIEESGHLVGAAEIERGEPKVGEEPAQTLLEYFERGTTAQYESLREAFPERLVDVVQVQGIGATRALALHEGLGVVDLPTLIEAARSGRLPSIKGIGAKNAENILAAAIAYQEELDAEAEVLSQIIAAGPGQPAGASAPAAGAGQQDLFVAEAPPAPPAPVEPPGSTLEAELLEDDSEAAGGAQVSAGGAQVSADGAQGAVEVKWGNSDGGPSLQERGDRIREALRIVVADEGDDGGDDEGDEQEAEDFLWSKLRCSACHAVGLESADMAAQCPNCGRRHAMDDHVIDMLGTSGHKRTIAQLLMEFEPYSNIYESLSRPLFTRFVSTRTVEDAYAASIDLLELDQGLKVLDLGCGPGNFTRRFADAMRGASTSLTVGVDRSAPMLRQARGLQYNPGGDGLRYIQADANHLPFADACMDRVHCAAALHLFSEPDRAVRELVRVTKAGGLIVISGFERRIGLIERLPKPKSAEWLLVLPVLPLALAVATSAVVIDSTHDAIVSALGIRWLEQGELRSLLEEAGADIIEEERDGMQVTVKAARI